jgi:hypothetical protein
VVKAARLHLGIGELETAATGGLTVNIGSAFGAKSADTQGFAGLFVDLFAKSDLLSELEDPQTWASWLASLRPGGCAGLRCSPSGFSLEVGVCVGHHIHASTWRPCVWCEGPRR